MPLDAVGLSDAHRINCTTTELDADTVRAMDAVWADAQPIHAPMLSRLDQVIRRLRRGKRASFRFEDFEQSIVLWQRLWPSYAIVQERRGGQLRRVHRFSRLPTGETCWQKQVAAEIPEAEDGFTGLLGFLVLVPCFDEWASCAAG